MTQILWKKVVGRPWVVTAAIVILAFALRLPQLTSSFWMDEAAQVWESVRPLSQQLQIRDDFQPPLLHLLTHAALQFSQAEWWLRWWGALLPALISLAILPFLTAQALNSKKANPSLMIVGWIAAVWLATNSFHVFYSEELRPYSLAALWVILTWWLLLAKKPPGWYVVSSLAGLYSTYLYPFALIGQFFYLFVWQRREWRQHMFVAGMIVVGFLPWLPSFFGQLQAGQQLRVDLPGWENAVATSQLKIFPLLLGKWLFGVSDLELTWPWLGSIALVCSLIGVLCMIAWREIKQDADIQAQAKKLWQLVVSWGVVPLTLAWIISFWIPVIQPKRVLWLWPLAAIGVGWLLLVGWKSVQKWGRLTAVSLGVLLLSINLSGLLDYYHNPKIQRENWRGLQQELSENYSPGSTVIVFAFPSPFASWRWYDQNHFTTISTGYLTNQTAEYAHSQLTEINDYQFVLVVDYLRSLTDPQDLILKSLESAGYKGVGVVPTNNMGFVRIYARPDSLLGALPANHQVLLQRNLP